MIIYSIQYVTLMKKIYSYIRIILTLSYYFSFVRLIVLTLACPLDHNVSEPYVWGILYTVSYPIKANIQYERMYVDYFNPLFNIIDLIRRTKTRMYVTIINLHSRLR